MSSIAAVRRPRSRRFFKLSKVEPYFFIAPFLILLLAFNIYTFVMGARMGFTDAQGINPGQWIGLENYKELIFHNKDFWPAVGRSYLFMLGSLVTEIPVAFILASILNSTVFGKIRGVLRAAFYVPVLINTVVAALIFRMLFNKDTGLINWLLAHVGFEKIDWLFTPELALPLMIVVAFWQWTGYHMVYLLASMQAIDPTIYEVAKLDGASPLRTMFQITLPLIRPAIMFVSIASAIGGMQQFEYSFMLFPNAGFGPGMKALTGVPFIFYYGFSNNFEFGLATAAGWLLFIMILALVLLQIRIFGLGQAEEY